MGDGFELRRICSRDDREFVLEGPVPWPTAVSREPQIHRSRWRRGYTWRVFECRRSMSWGYWQATGGTSYVRLEGYRSLEAAVERAKQIWQKCWEEDMERNAEARLR